MKKHYSKNLSTKILGLALLSASILMSSLALAGTKNFDRQLKPILKEYLKIPKLLSQDKTEGVAAAAKKIEELASKLDASTVKGQHAKHYKDIPKNIKNSAAKLAAAKDIVEMREALKDLSKPFAMWATMSKPKGISVMYCSMAKGSWLQSTTLIANPYYGSKMLRCGQIVAGQGAKNK